MSKKIILLIFLSLFLVGCNKQGEPSSTASQENKEEIKEESFSLKNALTLGKSVKCTYTTEKGTVTTYIKDKKLKVEGAGIGTDQQSGGMINDGENIYLWNDKDKKGLKFAVEPAETSGAENPEFEDLKNPEKWAAGVEDKYQIKCDPTVTTDATFVPPSDVEFQDLSAMMEQMKNLAPGNMPQFSVPPMPEPEE